MKEHWRPDPDGDPRRIDTVLRVLDDPEIVTRMRAYYDPARGYAGATFLDLEPADPDEWTAADLLAVTTLSVSVSPVAIRRILDSGEGEEATAMLREIPHDLRLWDDRVPEHAPVMAEFYLAVKHMLRVPGASSSNAWVTASKLCARKRPDLFPVRDTVVTQVLGLTRTYSDDWPAFAAIVRDRQVTESLQRLLEDIRTGPDGAVTTGSGDHPLRHLDSALWLHGIAHRRSQHEG